MIVVSDTSVISNLLTIGQLELLRLLFKEVYVTPAVNQELSKLSLSEEQKANLASRNWISIHQPSGKKKIEELNRTLDLGESEAIALAIEFNALLLIDERKGWKVARAEGLATTGLIGVLLLAKKHGIIPEVKSVIDELRIKTSFYLKPELVARVIRECGE